MEPLFYLLAILQILTGLYLVVQGMQWLSYVKRCTHSDRGFYTPRTAVLCPCKGMEPGLESNLTALTTFDFQNYEVFFILASASDPAHSIVKRVAEHSGARTHVLITEKPVNCGEKVNNLRLAIEQLPADFDVYVFADSDGRPGKTWLRHLVAPLSDARVGATTTMRWLMPNDNSFATALLAAWNAPVVSMLTEKGKNFCWGGGTAIRRSIFEQSGVLEEWRNSVSDDYSLTTAMQRRGHPIVFVPECLTISFVETDVAGLLEFTNRQIVITRVYAKNIWAIASLTHLLYCLTLVLGALLTLENVFAGRPAFHLAALTFLPMLLSAIRGAMRVAGVTEALPSFRLQIMNQAWIYIVLNVFVPFLYVYNFVVSVFTRKIRWRGIVYELISPQQTRILLR